MGLAEAIIGAKQRKEKTGRDFYVVLIGKNKYEFVSIEWILRQRKKTKIYFKTNDFVHNNNTSI